MNAPPLLNGVRVRRRIILYSASLTLFAIGVISLYLAMLIQLPAEQWRGFAQIVAVLFAILFALATALNARSLHVPMLRCLNRVAEGSAGEADVRRGFAAVANFPLTSFASGCLEWFAGSAAVGLAMYARYPDLSAFTATVMFLGGASGGLISVIGFYFIAKRELEAVRLGLAALLPNPEARHALVREVSLRRKLLVSVTAVTLATGVFALCYARVESGRFLEKYVVSIQHRFLARVAGELRPGGTPDPGAVQKFSEWLGAPSHLLLLDSRGRRFGPESPDALTPNELREIQRRGLARGESSGFDSPHLLAWVRLPEDGRILVSVVPWSALAGAQEWSTLELGALLAVFTVLALAVASLAAEDVARATGALRSSAARVAAGDLRAAPAFDSEDELGALSLRFEQMAQALRSAVVQLAATADGVESAAGGIAGSTGRVVQANAEQAAHIESASVTTERIHVEVRGIAESAERLTYSTESASSSILEIGVTGGQLAQSARSLASRVDEVFSSIEDLSSSGRQISETTETLASAAEETSGSMEEMAGSVLQVDRHAEDVRQLAERTVAMAESGHSRVLDTIRGMEAIREATEVAQRVIGNLGERSEQIGAIVNVIDDVADETGLLALNAAIIAAQAGENGRAFSVVADEIRNLADRVLRSTKEIAEVISGLQAESANAVGAIERGAGSVRSGVALSVEAGDSLAEITASARESGARIAEIAAVMREQTESARHVVGLMERVRSGVGEIRSAGAAGRRGHEGLLCSASAMREVALQVEAATAEQSRGLATIRDGSESVRAAVEEIDSKLRVQSHACGEAADLLERVYAETRSNEQSAASIGAAMRDLRERARRLREEVGRFRV